MKTQHLDPRVSSLEYLAELVKGKNVLDLGCVEHNLDAASSEFWLHAHLARTAGSILGMDILEEDVDALRKRGYNMVCGDATTVSLDQKFDFIIAGELIEHVVNPGGLLSNMRRHLNENGRLVVTTPHAFYALNPLVAAFSLQKEYWHPDHVNWYCPVLLEGMLRKTGYEMEACYYFTRSRKLRKLLRTVHLPCYGFMAQSFMAIARPSASAVR